METRYLEESKFQEKNEAAKFIEALMRDEGVRQSSLNINLAIEELSRDYNAFSNDDINKAYCAYYRAQAYQANRQYNHAISDLTFALNFFNTFPEAYQTEKANCLLNEGKVFQALAKYKEAIESFTLALTFFQQNTGGKNDHGLASCYYYRGLCNQVLENEVNALFDFEMASKLYINNVSKARCHNNIGSIYYKTQKSDQAFSEFDKALGLLRSANNKVVNNFELSNTMAMMYFNRANTALSLREGYPQASQNFYSKAAQDFSQALSLFSLDNPKREFCFFNYGHVLFKIEKYKETIEQFDILLNLYPGSSRKADYYFYRAQAYEAQAKRDRATALRDYRQALYLNPNYASKLEATTLNSIRAQEQQEQKEQDDFTRQLNASTNESVYSSHSLFFAQNSPGRENLESNQVSSTSEASSQLNVLL